MKVAFDTNVLISAYATRGLSADVFRHVLSEHEVLLSEKVLEEFERVLLDRFGVPVRIVREFTEELRLHEVVGKVGIPPALDCIRDQDDRCVVAAAIAGGAEYLVTGDKDVLDFRDQLSGIKALTPREYWESVRKPGRP